MPVYQQYKLIYFDFEARGEIARYLFAQADVAYEDFRILEMEEWRAFKPKTPYGQLPLLEFDGNTLAQSDAINRFLARNFGLYGTDAWEQAKIDEITQKIAEDVEKIMPTFFQNDAVKKSEMYQPLLETVVKPLFQLLDKKLADSTSGWLIGKQISLADITAFHWANVFLHGRKLPPNDLHVETYPKMADFMRRVAAEPNLAKYLKMKKQRQQATVS